MPRAALVRQNDKQAMSATEATESDIRQEMSAYATKPNARK